MGVDVDSVTGGVAGGVDVSDGGGVAGGVDVSDGGSGRVSPGGSCSGVGAGVVGTAPGGGCCHRRDHLGENP